jgi:hypothetical protein
VQRLPRCSLGAIDAVLQEVHVFRSTTHTLCGKKFTRIPSPLFLAHCVTGKGGSFSGRCLTRCTSQQQWPAMVCCNIKCSDAGRKMYTKCPCSQPKKAYCLLHGTTVPALYHPQPSYHPLPACTHQPPTLPPPNPVPPVPPPQLHSLRPNPTSPNPETPREKHKTPGYRLPHLLHLSMNCLV